MEMEIFRTKNILITIGMLASLSSNAASLNLIGGYTDPFNTGFVPVPPNDPIPFLSADTARMSDGSLGTGFSFTSNAGDFSSQPYSVVGFGTAFEFDISSYVNIERIDFTWTGSYIWDGATFPRLRFGPSSPIITAQENFGTSSVPDNQIHTVNVSFFNDSTGFDALYRILHNDIAVVQVSTDLGHSTSQSTITYHTLNTLEVSANIVGTMVPIPPAIWLFGSGLISLIGITRLKRKSN